MEVGHGLEGPIGVQVIVVGHGFTGQKVGPHTGVGHEFGPLVGVFPVAQGMAKFRGQGAKGLSQVKTVGQGEGNHLVVVVGVEESGQGQAFSGGPTNATLTLPLP